MIHELLSPAGDIKCLKAAVLNGADAVYVGGKRFGARAFAPNFTMEELKEAIEFCHLYGVRLYVTVNTMIYESELSLALDYLKELYILGVDAVILADIGLIYYAHQCFPNLEIHASTQMHTHNLAQLSYLKQLGVKRVVLARELTLEEIKSFLDLGLEIEIFVHGALCVSYSGECLFSSLLMDRSGNRGSCAGICRLPFSLMENKREVSTPGKYLLSRKELNTSTQFDTFLKLPITSFKIEGRMKSEAYVAFITRYYRHLIDSYDKNFILQNQKDLESLFNREFTLGYAFGNQNMMNFIAPNHQGSFLGTVLKVTKAKIKIRLEEDLHQEDGIRFPLEQKGMIVNFLYNEKGLLVNAASKGNIVFVDNKIGLTKVGEVRKTLDKKLEKELLQLPSRKIPINFKIDVEKDLIKVSICDGHFTIMKSLSVEKALKAPLSKEDFTRVFEKLGNTPFKALKIDVVMQADVFTPMSHLNELRRSLVEELILKRSMKRKEVIVKEIQKTSLSIPKASSLLVSFKTKEQFDVLREFKIDSLYTDNAELLKFVGKHVSFVCPEPKKEKNCLVGESGSMLMSSSVICDTHFNIANHAGVEALLLHSKGVVLSIEAKEEEVASILEKTPYPVYYYLYGRVEVMTIKNNLLKSYGVSFSKENSYALKDQKGRMYPMTYDSYTTHIYYHEVTNRMQKIKELEKLGIHNFYLEFTFEDASLTRKVLEEYFRVKKC